MKQSLLIAAACGLAISMAPLALSAATDQDLPGQPTHYYANGVWHIYGDHYVRMFDPPVTSVAAPPVDANQAEPKSCQCHHGHHHHHHHNHAHWWQAPFFIY
ncbi:MAG: hypothetical protein HQL79_02360 [Magnetococcales bacterium]|nr:hypothetical protein [Magnetococcales bacterium]